MGKALRGGGYIAIQSPDGQVAILMVPDTTGAVRKGDRLTAYGLPVGLFTLDNNQSALALVGQPVMANGR